MRKRQKTKVQAHADNRKSTDEKIEGNVENGTAECSVTEMNDSSELNLQFNEDLLCEFHGELDPDASCRKLIPERMWLRLREYFPKCPEYPSDTPICKKCCTMLQEDEENKDVNKRLASEQKLVLGDLFHDRKRPQKFTVGQEMYVVSANFLDKWRKFIRDPLKKSAISDVTNTILLCRHGGYMYPPNENPPDVACPEVIYIWPSEWEIIGRNFIVDEEIMVITYEEEIGKGLQFATLPEVCRECVNSRNMEIELAKYEYVDAVVYVRKIPKDSQSQNNSLTETSTPTTPTTKEEDPEYVQLENLSETDEPPEKMVKIESGTRRKSARHRKVRGEKEVKVTSSQTLKDFKLQVMKLFSVPPFDQNLFMSGVSLTENTATLGELKVAPGAIIMLQADEPVEDPGVLQDIMHVTAGPEEGFKGTGLLSRS